MKHIGAILLKFVMVAVVLEIILRLLTNVSFLNILYIALTVTIVSYLLGDLAILPRSNNTVATISDAVLALAVILLFNVIYTTANISFLTALLAAAVLGIGEWAFHRFMSREILPSQR